MAVGMKRDTDERRPERVLIACDYFWPSIGGVEIIAENLGYELTRRGFHVDVATGAHPARVGSLYRGMNVLSLDRRPGWFSRSPKTVRHLRRLLEKGNYDGSILIADPLNWVLRSIEGAELPSGMKLAIQPLINEEGYDQWRGDKEFRRRLAEVLRRATMVVALTRGGQEIRFLNEEGIPSVYLPNAVRPCRPSANFRELHGIPGEVPMLLHVANLWPVKNHLGLLESLRDLEGEWRLVLIGHTSPDAAYAEKVRAAVAKDPRVMWIPGAAPEEVSAAMEAAHVVLLASHAEVSPVTVMEAMSHGKPWVATPSCGAVHDWAGGVVVPLPGFRIVLRRLLGDPALCNSLGESGYTHWKECYTWEAVASGWERFLRTGTVGSSFAMPEETAERMASAKSAIMAI
jgi:O-antigen biosynthesis protein